MVSRTTRLLIAAAIGWASLASAQAQTAKQPAAGAAPAPGAPGQQGSPPPQGPMKVDLISTGPEWVKVCGQDQSNQKKICYTTRDFSTAADQPPAIAVAIYDIQGDENRVFRLLTPVGLLLRPGFRFSIDKGAQIEGSFEICMPNGCFAESKIKNPTIDSMKKGTTLNVVFKNSLNNELTFTIPLAGFGKTFDGPAIDPKELERKQQEVQQQLQQKLEERAKTQRQQLEQQSGTAPAAPAPASAKQP